MGEAARVIDWTAIEPVEPDVIAVPDLAHETFVQRKHAHWIGSLALENTVESPSTSERQTTALLDLIEKARSGDEQALASIRMNAHTTVIETLLKTGNITRITAELDEYGNLQQHGHTYDAIHRNAWKAMRDKSPVARKRSEIEALNWHRTEAAIRAGLLENNWFVVFSSPSDNESIAELKRQGNFVHTMTSVFQATTIEDGGVKTESAFVAGMEAVQEDPQLSDQMNNARIADAAANRYDITTIRALYMHWGIESAEHLDAEALLATPLLIPKQMMPSGVASVVELYDSMRGDTFFGLRQPSKPYETYADECAARAETYNDITAKVVRDLLANADRYNTPADAVQAMYELVKTHTVERAVRDHSIDATVFGAKAAPLIYQARMAYDDGDQLRFAQLANQTQAVAETTACGGGASGKDTDKGLEKSETAVADEARGVINKTDEVWKWKKGICRVESCPTRPGKTEVGPCDVCRRCQRVFDKGIDPTKFKTSRGRQRQQVVTTMIAGFNAMLPQKTAAPDKLALVA